MITRRQFCKTVGAGVLVAGLPSFAMASSPERAKVIGIGGAGCNIVERLREQEWIAEKAETLTVNRVDPHSRRSPVDLILGPSDPQLSFSYSRSDLRKIDALMEGTQRVILVAGLGGQTGTNLITRFAASTLCAEVPVASVVTTPLEFEGKRDAIAQKALRHLVKLSRRTFVIDNDRAMSELPGTTTMLDAFTYLDNLAIAEVRNLLQEPWHG